MPNESTIQMSDPDPAVGRATSPLPRLTVTEIARWLGRHPRTIRRLARQGRLPALRVGGQWTFTRQEIEAHGRVTT